MAKVWRDLLSATKQVRAEADDYKHWISSSYPALLLGARCSRQLPR
jgi:hypothetical protein